MYMSGHLLNRLDLCFRDNCKMALLVIDEHEDAVLPHKIERGNILGSILPETSSVTAFQQRLIMYAQRMEVPVWCIRQRSNTYGPLRTQLTALYNGKQILLKKSCYNAFNGTSLHNDLKKLEITHLIVMGWNANVCVAATVGVFVPRNSLDIQDCGMGAIQLGYKVFTCKKILHGDAKWSHDIRRCIEFFESL